MTKLETKFIRSFDDWWNNLPDDFGKNPRKTGSKTKLFFNQISYVIVHNNLKGNGHLNPTYKELGHWLRSGQIGSAR